MKILIGILISCFIIGGILGFSFLGQSDNPIIIDNKTDIQNKTEIIIENKTQVENQTEIENNTFKHNFSQFTLLK